MIATKQCNYCGTNKTPMWRSGPAPMYKVLCNKCGVSYARGKILVSQKREFMISQICEAMNVLDKIQGGPEFLANFLLKISNGKCEMDISLLKPNHIQKIKKFINSKASA